MVARQLGQAIQIVASLENGYQLPVGMKRTHADHLLHHPGIAFRRKGDIGHIVFGVGIEAHRHDDEFRPETLDGGGQFIADGIPVQDMVRVKRYVQGYDAVIFGPNTAGVITPEECKVGIMPASIYQPGRVGVVSRSGTLNYEAVAQMTARGHGQSTSVGIGGDPINGANFVDVLRAFNDDPDTDAVVLIGEIGGTQEVDAAKWAKDNMDKPVIGFIAGVSAPVGRRMGHAGAIISGEADTAVAKMNRMEELGVHVVRNPANIGETVDQVLKQKTSVHDRSKSIHGEPVEP